MATAMITNFFKKATPADIEEQKKRDAVYWAKRKEEEAKKLARDDERRMAAQKAKRPVGRPKMKRQPDVVLISPIEEVEVEELVATQPPTKKSRCGGSYWRWGNPNLWPLIAQAVALHPQSLTDALNHLQHIMKPCRIGSPFDALTISTMKGWYAKDQGTGHWLLKDDMREKIGLMAAKKVAQVCHNMEKPRGILKDHPETTSQIVDCFKGMRLAGQQIDSSIIRTTIQGVIVVGAPELFDRVVGKDKDGQPVKFSVSKMFTKTFAQRHLGWTWRQMTRAARKLPKDWVVQGEEMAFRVAALCSMHSVPDCLVVNSDQTGMHLKPFSERMYEVKGAKQVLSLGKEDKRQFTVLGSTAADGVLLPLQVVFQGKTGQVLPKNAAAMIATSEGWHLTHSANHWST
jgi:hypothetical protein